MDRADVPRKHQTKLALVVHNFFVKVAGEIALARVPPGASATATAKQNRWFNLIDTSAATTTIGGADLARWKEGPPDQQPPLILEVCLDLRKLALGDMLVVYDDDGAPWEVLRKQKQEVVLERWLVEFDVSELEDVELPVVYKQAIVLFRLLYLLLRLMPTASLVRRGKVDITVKVIDGRSPISSKGRIGLLKPIMVPLAAPKSQHHISHKTFRAIMTPAGTLRVSAAYRNLARFDVVSNTSFSASFSVSPCTLERRLRPEATKEEPHVSDLPPPTPPQPIVKLAIQPFRIGSLSTLPPTLSSATPPAVERRVLIALNRSNALLAAMLRQQRNLMLLIQLAVPITTTISIPRLVSLQHPEATPDSLANNTPRFLSLFGLRNRRLSTTRPQDSLILGTSAGLALSTTGLGIEADSDDISGFVRMIDSKLDLRFGSTTTTTDPLNKYALLRVHHQQFGDSVNALFYLLSLRKLSAHSGHSYSPPGSYPEPSQFPSISTRLDERPHLAASVTGMATTPSRYQDIHYENVFDDDDDEEAEEEEGEEEEEAEAEEGEEDTTLQGSKLQHEEEEDDDLLFTMSDMNINKH